MPTDILSFLETGQPATLDIPPQPRILVVTGSPRRGGNSDKLGKRMAATAEEVGAPCYLARLPDFRIQPCIGCEQCRKDRACTGLLDGMHLLYPHIAVSRGLLLISPVHNYNVTSWMKAFIDRLYPFYTFGRERPGDWSSRMAGQGRKAAIVSIGEQHGEDGIGLTLDAMRLPLEALGYDVLDPLPVTGVFERGKITGQAKFLQRAEILARQLAEAVQAPES